MNEEKQKQEEGKGGVMDAIRKGEVQMRPRWHFIAHTAFAAVGSMLVFLSILYAASLAVFFMRRSGALFAPAFGLRGWFALVHELPWLIILLVLLFIVILEILVSRFRFVYKKPLVFSLGGIVALAFLGSFAIAQTPLHRGLLMRARHGDLPPPMDSVYGRLPPPRGEIYHGTITELTERGFIVTDIGSGATTSIVLTPRTRLPRGSDFSEGDTVVVIGDRAPAGEVIAFGAMEADE